MKLLLSTLMLSGCLMGWSQTTSNVPDIALTDFNNRMNSVNNNNFTSNWETIDNGFKVSYTGDLDGFVYYDDMGHVKSTWEEALITDMRPEVQDYITNNYSKKKVVKAYKLNSDTAPERAIVVVKHKGEEITIYFRPNGEFHYQE